MKKISELSHSEILSLSDRDIEHFIDLECAEEGIAVVEEPKKPDIMPEEKFIPGYWISGIIVTDLSVAETIQGCLQANREHIAGISDYCYEKGEFLKAAELDKIKSTKVKRPISKIDQDLRDKLKPLWDRYEKDKAGYTAYQNLRAQKASQMYSVKYEHHNLEDKILYLRRQCFHYIKLAEGDKTIAWNFLQNAHKEALLEVSEFFSAKEWFDSHHGPEAQPVIKEN